MNGGPSTANRRGGLIRSLHRSAFACNTRRESSALSTGDNLLGVRAVRGYFSDTEEISSRPFFFRMSRTTSPFSLSSTWTAMRYPPFLMRSSYTFASYSGIPRPTRPPTTPPAVAPAAAPLRAAIMGPAAIKGPKPGIASAPTPASRPTVAPTAPPPMAPVVPLQEPLLL